MALKSFNISAVAVAACLWLASCTSTAHIEKAKNVQLENYKTYSWLEPQKTKTIKTNRQNDIAQQNIKMAVAEQLQKNGFVEVSNNPDVLVTTDLVVEKNNKQQNDPVYSQPFIRSYYNPYRSRINTIYFPSQFMGYDTYSTTVKEGTVTVTLIDTKTDKTVWQGWSTEELDRAHISDKEINKNVKSIFKKFDKSN